MSSNEHRDPDPSRNQHVFQYDPEEERELGTAVTTAVASVTGTPVKEVGESLVDTVDTDGLDRIFRSTLGDPSPRSERLELTIDGCFVTVNSNGRITVEP